MKFSNILQLREMAKKSLELMVSFLNEQVGHLHGQLWKQMLRGHLLNRRAAVAHGSHG